MVSTVRWGIISTGWISEKFVGDLIIDPTTRGVTDVAHRVAAVASRTTERAAEFIKKSCPESGAKAYGTYQELYDDPDVDAVYIGTPHSHHYQNAWAALLAGKNILCEKSLTVNAAQAEALVALAREKKLFFMEAVWLRFTPAAYKVQELVRSGVIGELRSIQSELCVNWNEKRKQTPGHRMIAPALAGGALLDLGPYAWVWLALLLLPPSSARPEPLPLPKVLATMTRTATGVDASTRAIMEFTQEDGRVIQANFGCSLEVQSSPKRVVIVSGSKGFLEIEWPTYRPVGLTYTAWKTEEDFEDATNPHSVHERVSFVPRPGDIWGYAWEADEVARCLRDKKLESDRMPLRETILVMQVFDEIRKQCGLEYPDDIETLEKRELE